MASTLLTGYTGILDDLHISQVFEIFRVPMKAAGHQIGRPHGQEGEAINMSFGTAFSAMEEAFLNLQGNANAEANVIRIVGEYQAMPPAGTVTVKGAEGDPGHEYTVLQARSIFLKRLQAYYPVFFTEGGGQDLQVAGR